MTSTFMNFSTQQFSEALSFFLSHSLLTNMLAFAALIAIPLSLRFELHGWEYEVSFQSIRKRTLNIVRYFVLANVVATLWAALALIPSSQIIFAVLIMMVAMIIAMNNILPLIPQSGALTFFWVLAINLWGYQKIQIPGSGEYQNLLIGTLLNLLLTFSTLALVMIFIALFHRLNRYAFFVNYGVQILSAVIAYQVIYWFSRFL